jgi:hypothetical protein
MRVTRFLTSLIALLLALGALPAAQAEALKPYILGDTPPGDFAQVSEKVANALKAQGFEIVGTYDPYPGTRVICVTNAELKAAAARADNGGFGVVERVALTEVGGKIQVAYVNPAYMGTAYGLGKLEGVSAKLKAALGAVKDFGSKGIEEEKLKPGVYHYGVFMPYFHDVDVLKEHPDYKTAVDTVEKNLGAGAGGTKKIYRVDLPGKEVSVFGVGFVKGAIDGPGKGDKDTDKEIMEIIDWQELRHTAYLPYELMVTGNKVIALPARYRIAIYFPDTPMMGDHGFTKIMSAPRGILFALEKVAGFERNY